SFLYCFFRFRWKTRILSPRPSSSTSAVTLAAAGLAMVPGSPLTASTSLNSTVFFLLSLESTLSIFTTSPGATRYCLPPVRITAYIKTLQRSGNKTRRIQNQIPCARFEHFHFTCCPCIGIQGGFFLKKKTTRLSGFCKARTEVKM